MYMFHIHNICNIRYLFACLHASARGKLLSTKFAHSQIDHVKKCQMSPIEIVTQIFRNPDSILSVRLDGNDYHLLLFLCVCALFFMSVLLLNMIRFCCSIYSSPLTHKVYYRVGFLCTHSINEVIDCNDCTEGHYPPPPRQ